MTATINGTTYNNVKEACEALNIKYGTVAGYAYKNGTTLLEALQHYYTEGMKTKTAEELETANTLPLYRVESINRHSRWKVKCKLCGREGESFTENIKTYFCECKKKEEPTYAPKRKDTERAEKDRIRQRDYHRLQREGLIPEGYEVHHLKYFSCDRVWNISPESIMENIMILTSEDHAEWHRTHPDHVGKIV